jgi:hypothetical protein
VAVLLRRHEAQPIKPPPTHPPTHARTHARTLGRYTAVTHTGTVMCSGRTLHARRGHRREGGCTPRGLQAREVGDGLDAQLVAASHVRARTQAYLSTHVCKCLLDPARGGALAHPLAGWLAGIPHGQGIASTAPSVRRGGGASASCRSPGTGGPPAHPPPSLPPHARGGGDNVAHLERASDGLGPELREPDGGALREHHVPPCPRGVSCTHPPPPTHTASQRPGHPKRHATSPGVPGWAVGGLVGGGAYSRVGRCAPAASSESRALPELRGVAAPPPPPPPPLCLLPRCLRTLEGEGIGVGAMRAAAAVPTGSTVW